MCLTLLTDWVFIEGPTSEISGQLCSSNI
jgi:hypothetical protein